MMLMDARCTNHQTDSAKVSRPPRGDGRTRAATVGGSGGARTGLGRCYRCGSCDRFVPHDDYRRTAGVGLARSTASGRSRAGAAAGRWTTAVDRNGPRFGSRAGSLDRTRDAGRSGVSLALDLQEHASSGGRTGPSTSSDQRQQRGGAAPSGRLQPAGQPQDAGRGLASRPQRAIRAHQCGGATLPRPWPASDLGGHEKERTGGRFQERRARVATPGRTRGGSRSRLHGQEAGQGHSLRRVRYPQQPGLGERGPRPRRRQA